MESVILAVVFFAALCDIRPSFSLDVDSWKDTIVYSPQDMHGHVHTLEAYRDPSTDCTSMNLTKADRANIVQIHNKLRRKVAFGSELWGSPGPQPKAQDLQIMEYDEDLEKLAFLWAAQCTFEHDAYRDIGGYDSVGQNILLDQSSEPLLRPHWGELIKHWYDEVQVFDKNLVNNYEENLLASNYAQIVNAKTSRVGCAYAHKNVLEGDTHSRIVVCNYGNGPAIHEPLYTEGEPCRRSTSHIVCHEGLIKAWGQDQ